MAAFEARDRSTVLIHYYRAMVGRADIWRTRMDTATNWAIVATAAVISFAIGNPSVPHYALAMAPLLALCFLGLEARRLTFYHLWQQRVLAMERGLIRPALLAAEGNEGFDLGPELARDLDRQLGETVPTMSITRATARRLRRIYIYLFGAQAVAWGVKLSSQPSPASSFADVVERAAAMGVPGGVWIGFAVAFLVLTVVVAATLGGVGSRPEELDEAPDS